MFNSEKIWYKSGKMHQNGKRLTKEHPLLTLISLLEVPTKKIKKPWYQKFNQILPS